MRIVDLSMTVEECDSAPFAKDGYYFKLKRLESGLTDRGNDVAARFVIASRPPTTYVRALHSDRSV